MKQLALFTPPARTLCGYCLGPLAEQPAGDYACDRCRPGLALVRTPEDWAAFQRAARRSR